MTNNFFSVGLHLLIFCRVIKIFSSIHSPEWKISLSRNSMFVINYIQIFSWLIHACVYTKRSILIAGLGIQQSSAYFTTLLPFLLCSKVHEQASSFNLKRVFNNLLPALPNIRTQMIFLLTVKNYARKRNGNEKLCNLSVLSISFCWFTRLALGHPRAVYTYSLKLDPSSNDEIFTCIVAYDNWRI